MAAIITSPFTAQQALGGCALSTDARNFTQTVFDLYAKNLPALPNPNPLPGVQNLHQDLLSWLKEKDFFSSTPKTTQQIIGLLNEIEANGEKWDLKDIDKNFKALQGERGPENRNYHYQALSLFLNRVFERAAFQNEGSTLQDCTPNKPFAEETLIMKIDRLTFKHPYITTAIKITATVVFFFFVTPVLNALVFLPLVGFPLIGLIAISGAGSTLSLLASYTLTCFFLLILAQKAYFPIKLAQYTLMYITGLLKPENSHKTVAKVINRVVLSMTFPTEILCSILKKTITPWPVSLEDFSEGCEFFETTLRTTFNGYQRKDQRLSTPGTYEKAFLRWQTVSHITLHAMFKQ